VVGGRVGGKVVNNEREIMTKRRVVSIPPYLNGWTKFIFLAITALIAVGIYITTINDNAIRSKENAEAIHENVGDIREIKRDIKYIIKGVDELRGINTKE